MKAVVTKAHLCTMHLQGSGVGSYSMHPGWTETVGARTAMGGLFDRMEGRIRSPAQGSDTATWLSMEVC